MFDYKDYWDKRYKQGGNSGAGSYGENAIFKAHFINQFIKENNIKSVLEVGCGDGHNLGLYEIENYLGLDVSQKAIDTCREKYKGYTGKGFRLMDFTPPLKKVDLVLCLDVLFHIFPKSEWEKTIKYCLDNGKNVIFYTFPKGDGSAKHVNDYDFEGYLNGIDYTKSELLPPESNSRFYTIK